MCGGPEQSLSPHVGRKSPCKADSTATMKKESPKPLDSCFCLLESAANDDLNSFKKCLEEGKGNLDDIGLWYSRSNGAKQMVLEQRTGLMIASLYGSLNVLRYLTSQYGMHGGDLDQTCGSDGSSALHCAAAGGSSKAIEAVYILLSSGADVNVCDIRGRRPADVISVPYGCADARSMLETLLVKDKMTAAKLQPDSNMFSHLMKCLTPSAFQDFRIDSALDGSSVESSISLSLPSNISAASTFSVSPSTSSSPKSPVTSSAKGYVEDVEKGIECSVDQPVPDIKNSFYTSDEFRMYSFKIRPCSRAYSHDWTECPFAHPGENARRRDPRRYHYSCVPCPDFRKGACSQGDACEYAHGVFECWLHPAQYRTRLCKDGPECNRKVCFFAHKAEELRPVYAATGSGLPSPILSAFTDMSCMSPPLAPCSPSLMPPFSPLQPLQGTRQGNLRTPPMSPSSSLSNALWPQPSVPTLHLPGASLQASRLRAMLHARDVPSNGDFDEQLLSDFQSLSAHSLSTQARMNAAVAASGTIATASRSNRYKSLGLGLAPSNLEELFASENLAPSGIPVFEAPLVVQFEQDNHPAVLPASSPSGIRAHFQQPSALPSPREVVGNLESLAMWTRLYGEGQGGKMEAQGTCKSSASPVSFGRTANKGNWDLGAGCAWSDWGSPTGKPEWGIHEEDLSKLRKSTSLHSRAATDEADRSRGQELPKEGHLFKQDKIKGGTPSKLFDDSEGMLQTEHPDASMLGSWIDNLSLDEIVA